MIKEGCVEVHLYVDHMLYIVFYMVLDSMSITNLLMNINIFSPFFRQ